MKGWHGLQGHLYGWVWFWVKSTLLRGVCSAVYAKEGFGDIQRRWLLLRGASRHWLDAPFFGPRRGLDLDLVGVGGSGACIVFFLWWGVVLGKLQPLGALVRAQLLILLQCIM